MSYSTWADFVYYQVGGIAEYNTIAYQALTANRNVVPTSSIGVDWSVLPSGGGGGVSSLVGGTGALTMSSGEATFTLVGNDIQMAITFPAPPVVVDSLNSLTGTIAIDTNAKSTIQIQTFSTNITVGLNALSYGIYIEITGGSDTATITSSLCVPSSVIQLTYIHTGGGGGAQYIKDLVPIDGSFTITCNTNIDAGDQINWLILNT